MGIWFGLTPFRSPLLRGSLLVSLPPPTKMFPFGGFPLQRMLRSAGTYSVPAGIPIRESRVQRLPAPTPGLSQLATPFLGARAEPSTGRLAGAGGGLARVGATQPLFEHPIPGGGDPAAGSPTATLLRLRPPRELPTRLPHPWGNPRMKEPRWGLPRVARRAVCARGRDVFTARW